MLFRTLFELVGLSRPAKKNAVMEKYLKVRARQEALVKEDEAFKILSFGSPDLDTAPTFLEAEIQNGSKQDITLGQFKFFLSYTVNPGGTFMRGGNAIMSWDIDLKLRKACVIPAQRVAKVVIYKTGDPIAFIDKYPSRHAGRTGMKRDFNWLCEYEMYSQNIFSLLSEIPSTAWLSLRTPAGRNGDFLRSKQFEMPKEEVEIVIPRVSQET
jgi:hypothetical protein